MSNVQIQFRKILCLEEDLHSDAYIHTKFEVRSLSLSLGLLAAQLAALHCFIGGGWGWGVCVCGGGGGQKNKTDVVALTSSNGKGTKQRIGVGPMTRLLELKSG